MGYVDAHHHFWDPARGDYGWLSADDPVLGHVHGPAEMADALAETGVAHTVLVQAAPTVAETEYLLDIAGATPHVAGVVGWIDFEDPGQRATLDRFTAHPKFLGLRPMIQDIADPEWMLRADIAWAFEAILDQDLTFDALGYPRHADAFETLFRRYPDLRCVIDHGLKPDIAGRGFDAWAPGIDRLAATGAYCKFSGLPTQTTEDWNEAELQSYVDHLVAAFGADRLMWGSDWPVLRLRAEYADWFRSSERLTAHLDSAAKDRIFAGTATDFYRLVPDQSLTHGRRGYE